MDSNISDLTLQKEGVDLPNEDTKHDLVDAPQDSSNEQYDEDVPENGEILELEEGETHENEADPEEGHEDQQEQGQIEQNQDTQYYNEEEGGASQQDDAQEYQQNSNQNQQYEENQDQEYGADQEQQYENDQEQQYENDQEHKYENDQAQQYENDQGQQYENDQGQQYENEQGQHYENDQGQHYDNNQEYGYGDNQDSQYDAGQEQQYENNQDYAYEDTTGHYGNEDNAQNVDPQYQQYDDQSYQHSSYQGGNNRYSGVSVIKQMSEHPDEAKLFVGGLGVELTEDDLKTYFKVYGEPIEAVIMRDPATGRSRGFGFVSFPTPEIADSALTQEHTIHGKTIDAKKAVPKIGHEKHVDKFTTKVFVGGIPPEVTEEEIVNVFSKHGNVINVHLMTDKATGRPRGFGFVQFEDNSSIESCIEDKELLLAGKPIDIKPAQPRQNASFSKYGSSQSRYSGGPSRPRQHYGGRGSHHSKYGGYSGGGNQYYQGSSQRGYGGQSKYGMTSLPRANVNYNYGYGQQTSYSSYGYGQQAGIQQSAYGRYTQPHQQEMSGYDPSQVAPHAQGYDMYGRPYQTQHHQQHHHYQQQQPVAAYGADPNMYAPPTNYTPRPRYSTRPPKHSQNQNYYHPYSR